MAAAAVYTIWGGEMFPSEPDPKGNPEGWTQEELRRWLAAVSQPASEGGGHDFLLTICQRNLFPSPHDTREQLLERVNANMRISRK